MSYIWQAIYSGGLTLTLVYLIMKKALAAWVFVVAEHFFSFVFIGMKVYFEQFARRGKHTSFAGVVQACIYMNDFMVELRYTESAEQLLVQITSHREMHNIFDVSDRVDRRLSSKLSGAFLLNHGYAE